ncbi:MAG: glycosyltransferase family 39 protein [Nanoarchaeota archaeon]
MNKKKTIIILIVLVGTLLRIYNLSSESINFDEAGQLELMHNPDFDYGNPPFYYLFLNNWATIFGTSELSIRFPSVIFGVLSIFMLYKLACLIFNEKVALLSALILALNPFHVFFSQQARMYSLFMLLSLLSLYYFFKILMKNKKSDLYLYLILNLLNLYTHYFAIFVLFSEILYFTAFNKNFRFKLKPFILANVLILMLYLPQFSKVYIGFIGKATEFNWGVKPSMYFSYLFSSFLGWNVQITAALLLLFLFGILVKFDVKTDFFGLLYVLLPILIGFFLSFTIPMLPRYFIFILPIYILFICSALTKLKYKWMQLIIILVILFITGFGLIKDYSNPINPQLRDIANYIKENSQEGEIILIDNYAEPTFEYYYNGNLTRIKLLSSTHIKENQIFYNSIEPKLGYNRIWLILSEDTDKYYIYRLSQDFKLISLNRFFKADLYFYETN